MAGGFCLKNPKTTILSQYVHPFISIYNAATSYKNSEKFNVSICCKKIHFGTIFVRKHPKIICVNFKPLCRCNFMLKIRKVPKNFWPRISKQSYSQKHYLCHLYIRLRSCNLIQKPEILDKSYFGPILGPFQPPFGPKPSKWNFSLKRRLGQF